SGSGVEHANKGVIGLHTFRESQAFDSVNHIAPSIGRGKTILQAELRLKESVDVSDNIRNHRSGRKEDAPLVLECPVISGQERFVEMDHRIGSLIRFNISSAE